MSNCLSGHVIVLPNKSFDADTQRHCAARRAGGRTLAAQCRCVPVTFTLDLMSEDRDFVVAAFDIQQTEFWRFSDAEVCSRLSEKFPSAAPDALREAVSAAKRLYNLTARSDFYFEPSVEAVTARALPYLRAGAPGLSERAYSAALHRILYGWMK